MRKLSLFLAVGLLPGCWNAKFGDPESLGHDLGPVRALAAQYEVRPGDVDAEVRRLRESAPAPLRLPARLAVSEGGRTAATGALLEGLRADPAAFSRVEPLPRLTPVQGKVSDLDQGRVMAASVGADYLLLVGGESWTGDDWTPLKIFDLTLVGMFVVPSQEVACKVRLTGALVDVSTGRPVAFVSAEGEEHGLVPSAMAEGDRSLRRQEKVREKVLGKLAAEVRAKVKAMASPPGA